MKTIAIIGLGKFGFYIAKSMSRLQKGLVAIDNNEKRVQEISSYVENAYVLDSADKNALEDAGIVDFDTVIVSIGENIEASIMTVMALKDLGNKNIIAKAISTTHGEILAKLGVTKVVHPEKIAGRMLIHNLVHNINFEKIDLSNSMRIMKFTPTLKFIGKSFQELQNEYNVKVISYKINGDWLLETPLDYTITGDEIIACVGNSNDMEIFSVALTE